MSGTATSGDEDERGQLRTGHEEQRQSADHDKRVAQRVETLEPTAVWISVVSVVGEDLAGARDFEGEWAGCSAEPCGLAN